MEAQVGLYITKEACQDSARSFYIFFPKEDSTYYLSLGIFSMEAP